MINKINKQKKRYWLKGGLIGVIVLFVVHLIGIFMYLFFTRKIPNYDIGDFFQYDLALPYNLLEGLITIILEIQIIKIILLISLYIAIPALIGYIYGKIKERKTK